MVKRKSAGIFNEYSRATQNRILKAIRLRLMNDPENEDSSSSAASTMSMSESQSEGVYISKVSSIRSAVDDNADVSSVHGDRISLSDNDENVNDNQFDNDFRSENSFVEDGSRIRDAIGDSSNSETSTSDSSDEDERLLLIQDNNDDVDYRPLYEGAEINVTESIILSFLLLVRHKLTGECLSDFLTLIEMICPRPNKYPRTKYKFKKHFKNKVIPLTRHYYCKSCFKTLENGKTACGSCNQLPSKDDYFIILSLENQLIKLFSRPEFRLKLEIHNNREKEDSNIIEDIYDGLVVKELSENRKILSNFHNLSLTWYTDGISPFKSSNFCIWPLYLTINNLPPSDRYKPENFILAGIWFGYEKPLPNLYLLPLRDQCLKLYRGIDVGLPNTPRVKAIIVAGTCDSPAKSLFLNMKQFNGKYGCQKCKLKGTRENRRWVYPYKRTLRLRTDEETQTHALEAVDSNRIICGVKGPSILNSFVHKPIRTTAIDVMHCVFSGVVKQNLTLWFDRKFRNGDYSLTHNIKLIDDRLCNITPPSFIQRRPRSISKHLSHWKASEFKNWFFYFSLIVLKNIMLPMFYEHYKLLVVAIFLLCKSSVTIDEINFSEKLIKRYVLTFQNYYGLENMSSNIHQLLHLPSVVRELGPLWTLSCFPYENMNGLLSSLIHGSKSAQLQICSSLSMLMQTFNLKNILTPETEVFSFARHLSSTRKKIKCQKIEDSLYVVGTLTRDVSIHNEEFLQYLIENRNVFKFGRVRKSNFIYGSEFYKRQKVTSSKFIKYHYNDDYRFGIVQYYIKITDCECRKRCLREGDFYAIVRVANIVDNLLHIRFERFRPDSFIYSYILTDTSHVVDIHDLKCVCFDIDIKDAGKKYFAEPVNFIEKE